MEVLLICWGSLKRRKPWGRSISEIPWVPRDCRVLASVVRLQSWTLMAESVDFFPPMSFGCCGWWLVGCGSHSQVAGGDKKSSQGDLGNFYHNKLIHTYQYNLQPADFSLHHYLEHHLTNGFRYFPWTFCSWNVINTCFETWHSKSRVKWLMLRDQIDAKRREFRRKGLKRSHFEIIN